MFDNQEDYSRVSLKIKEGGNINDFKDGLKFIGRIQSITKNISINPETGQKQRGVTISAVAFREINTVIHFNPFLNTNANNEAVTFLIGLSQELNNLQADRDGLLNDINNWILRLFATFMSEGPKNSEKNTNFVRVDGQEPRSYNQGFRIPVKIASLLGVKDAMPTFSSITKILIGTQKYKSSYLPELAAPSANSATDRKGLDFRCKDGLQGFRFDQISPFESKSIWSILNTPLNPTINEIYNVMRVDSSDIDGKIMPFIVARQIPLTSPLFLDQFPNIVTTAFHELPRWKIDAKQVLQMEVGRSDSFRANYVQVLINEPISDTVNQASQAYQEASNICVVDSINVLQDGLKPYLTSVNIANENISKNPETAKAWTRLVADRIISGHLRYTGSMTISGIQEPIAIGDNLEFNDILYHIEQITHSVRVNPETGQVIFTTNLGLTNGVNVNYKDDDYNSLWPELTIYETDKNIEKDPKGNED